jgi:hypothetical protein
MTHVKAALRSKRVTITLSNILLRKVREARKDKQSIGDCIRRNVALSIQKCSVPFGAEDLPERQRYWRRNYSTLTMSLTDHMFGCLSEFAAGAEMSLSEAIEYHYWRYSKETPDMAPLPAGRFYQKDG